MHICHHTDNTIQYISDSLVSAADTGCLVIGQLLSFFLQQQNLCNTCNTHISMVNEACPVRLKNTAQTTLVNVDGNIVC